MPSLNIFRIEFDRLDAVYIAGDTVSGSVVIDLAREKIAEGKSLLINFLKDISIERSQICAICKHFHTES